MQQPRQIVFEEYRTSIDLRDFMVMLSASETSFILDTLFGQLHHHQHQHQHQPTAMTMKRPRKTKPRHSNQHLVSSNHPIIQPGRRITSPREGGRGTKAKCMHDPWPTNKGW